MDFSAILTQIDQRLDKNYSEYNRKISRMTQFSNAKSLVGLEVVEINNYLEAVRLDLKNRVEEELLQSYKISQVNEMIEDMFPALQVRGMQLREEQVMKSIAPKPVRQMPVQTQSEQEFPVGAVCVGAAIGLVGGVAVGAILTGAALEGMVIGGVAGGVAGGTMGYMLEGNKEKNQGQAESSSATQKVFDKAAFAKMMQTREEEIRKLVRRYVKQVEDQFNSLNKGY